MPGHKSYQRYFNKFDQAKNHEVFTNLYQWFFSNLHFDNYTLDFDSSVITRYGEQEGEAKGYNYLRMTIHGKIIDSVVLSLI